MASASPTPGVGIIEARRRVSKIVGEAFARAASDPAVRLGIKVGLGIGKTRAALSEASKAIRSGVRPIVLAVPTHRLLNDILARPELDGTSVGTWRGREATNPNTGDPMCLDLKAVRDVQSVAGNVQTMVCDDGDGHQCTHFSRCPYQAQRLQEADLWLIPHASLFHERPTVIGDPSLVIIDENFSASGLSGISGPAIALSLQEIATPPIGYRKGRYSDAATADLRADLLPLRVLLSEAVEGSPVGPLNRQALLDARLTAASCHAAAKSEWRGKVSVRVEPGMPASERSKMVAQADRNRLVRRLARLWKLLAALLGDDGPARSGCIEIEDHREVDGVTYRRLRMRWRKDFATSWVQKDENPVPVIHLDATLRPELVRPFLPRLEVVADIQAESPHQRVIQYPDRTFSKVWASDEKHIDQVWWWTLALAQWTGGRWLLIVQKSVEDSIRARHQVPSFIALGHHNGLRGVDAYGDVRGVVIVGRTMPPPTAVEHLAGALTGEALKALSGWYPTKSTRMLVRGDVAATVDADVHPDAKGEAVRQATCEDEILQLIGRVRGLNRTEINPVEVHVLGNLPLVLARDEIREWQKPNLDEELFARSGVWIGSTGDAAQAAGINGESLKKARQRASGRLGTFSNKKSLYGNVPNLRRVVYQRNGSGHSRQEAVYDTRRIFDIRAWLKARLGTLASCETEESDTCGQGMQAAQ